jgi:hypothetical protein
MPYIAPPDSHRLRILHAEPVQAHPEEVQHMAEELSQFRRAKGTKTLLDEFAMASLAGLMEYVTIDTTGAGDFETIAKLAYSYGAAMMKVRSNA